MPKADYFSPFWSFSPLTSHLNFISYYSIQAFSIIFVIRKTTHSDFGLFDHQTILN